MKVLAACVALSLGSCGATRPSDDSAEKPAYRLIAHRGGVVGDDYAENSPAALNAAIERGYWMVEVDVRESSDGALVVHHDEDFQRFYGDPRLLSDLSWSEIAELRAKPGDSRPHTFREMAEIASGRIRFMLDTKPPEHADAFFDEMESALADNGMLKSSYVIGTEQSRRRFLGKAKVGATAADLWAAVEAGEDVAQLYFLFEHGRDLDRETVERALALGVAVVPSINIFHYDDVPDHMAAAQADVARMIEYGVSEFQIDSPYDGWLR